MLSIPDKSFKILAECLKQLPVQDNSKLFIDLPIKPLENNLH